MASKYTNIVETDIFDITNENRAEKLKEHIGGVIKLMNMLEYHNVKMVTRIKEISPREAIIITDIEEEIKKILGE